MQLVHVLFFLSLCHEADVRTVDDQFTVQVKSADEKCIIDFVKFLGVEFLGYDHEKSALVKFNGKMHKFKVLYNFKMNNKRRRQSIIIEKDDG